MPRYIESKYLVDWCNEMYQKQTKIMGKEYCNAFLQAVVVAPTADVVPKSEVAELICKLECLLCHVTGGRLSKHTYDLATMETVATYCINETYNDGYGEGYKDCATEIFEEIKKIIEKYHGECYEFEDGDECDTAITYISYISVDIDELKKKYTGGESNGSKQ